MIAIVWGDWALIGKRVYKLGCDCVRPRRRREEVLDPPPHILKALLERGQKKEIR